MNANFAAPHRACQYTILEPKPLLIADSVMIPGFRHASFAWNRYRVPLFILAYLSFRLEAHRWNACGTFAGAR